MHGIGGNWFTNPMHLEEQVRSTSRGVLNFLTKCDTNVHNSHTSRHLYLRTGTCGLDIIRSVGKDARRLHSSSLVRDQPRGGPSSSTCLGQTIQLTLREAGFASEFQGLRSQMRSILNLR
jgi:hypothetical protein